MPDREYNDALVISTLRWVISPARRCDVRYGHGIITNATSNSRRVGVATPYEIYPGVGVGDGLARPADTEPSSRKFKFTLVIEQM